MAMTRDEATTFLQERTKGVLATLKQSDGRPQLSNIMYTAADGIARISVTATRAKTRNALADDRVSLHVTSDDFWTYVVAEGRAELSPVAAEPGDATCRELLQIYERVAGSAHDDADRFHQAMVEEERQVMRVRIERMYPVEGAGGNGGQRP